MSLRSKCSNRSEYLEIPKSLRMVLEAASAAEWVSMREFANEEAEARWSDKTAASAKQSEEVTAVCATLTAANATLTEEKRALSAKLIEVEAEAAAKDQAARDDAASSSRRLKEVTEGAQRASKCSAEIASDTATLKVLLDAAQSLLSKIETAHHTPILRCKCVEEHAFEGDSLNTPALAGSPFPLDAGEPSRLNSADVIAAAGIILKAASSLQAIGAISAACSEFGHVSWSRLIDVPGINGFDGNHASGSSGV